ncbi:hypothetical protein L798_14490 [Zootermopsis nevadensis]|uniref:Helitron helicase-like domain-containing protein n=1 Tax=Zootermopsis nevadensis TaxID=136037 RepID=A0A067RKR2_ZOONE|nr:hypothetical protein L798_14490 [Zootermopsis nevadensis]
MFARYRIATREKEFNPITKSGKLFQQYLVDTEIKREKDVINYLRYQLQPTKRVDKCSSLKANLEKLAKEMKK